MQNIKLMEQLLLTEGQGFQLLVRLGRYVDMLQMLEIQTLTAQ